MVALVERLTGPHGSPHGRSPSRPRQVRGKGGHTGLGAAAGIGGRTSGQHHGSEQGGTLSPGGLGVGSCSVLSRDGRDQTEFRRGIWWPGKAHRRGGDGQGAQGWWGTTRSNRVGIAGCDGQGRWGGRQQWGPWARAGAAGGLSGRKGWGHLGGLGERPRILGPRLKPGVASQPHLLLPSLSLTRSRDLEVKGSALQSTRCGPSTCLRTPAGKRRRHPVRKA